MWVDLQAQGASPSRVLSILLPVLLPALDLQPGSRFSQIKARGHLSSQLTLVLPAPQPGAQGRIWR